jgi:predicted nucleotidyltransferase
VTPEPRTQHDYGEREVAAAKRVLVDLGQVLGFFLTESVVVVGGWVPDLLLIGTGERHVGSIDVDLALDAERLHEGRYAEIVKAMLATGRYRKTDKEFKFQAEVDLGDGGSVLVVDVDFLKPVGKLRRGGTPRLLDDFRALDADGCAAAFRHPERVEVDGQMLSGARNHVTVLVASIADFLVMKSYALAGRDKPKDAYDICYCLDNVSGGVDAMARAWREWRDDEVIVGAIAHLREKFASVESYGPMQVATFYDDPSSEEEQMRARRAYELVSRFLELVG